MGTRLILSVWLLLCLPVPSFPQIDPVEEFARRVEAAMEPGETASVAFRSLGQHPPQLERMIADRLRAKEGSPSTIRVTFSEDLHGPLWVAEIERARERRVVFYAPPPSEEQKPPPPLAWELLFEQARPVLDVLTFDGRMIVLEPDRVVVDGVATVIPNAPVNRDPRGRLERAASGFRIHLPGLDCEPMAEAIECTPADAAWPMDGARAAMVKDRNYFDGRLVLADGTAKQVNPFFNGARIGESWVIAGASGAAWISDDEQSPVEELGDEVASIEAGCGGRHVVLAARQEDEEAIVTANDVQGRAVIRASAPLSLAGSITALWPAAEPQSAVAILRRNGRYAVYRLWLPCHP